MTLSNTLRTDLLILINSQNPYIFMPFEAGREEDLFLQSLNIVPKEIEFKAKDCTQVSLLYYHLIS